MTTKTQKKIAEADEAVGVHAAAHDLAKSTHDEVQAAIDAGHADPAAHLALVERGHLTARDVRMTAAALEEAKATRDQVIEAAKRHELAALLPTLDRRQTYAGVHERACGIRRVKAENRQREAFLAAELVAFVDTDSRRFTRAIVLAEELGEPSPGIGLRVASRDWLGAALEFSAFDERMAQGRAPKNDGEWVEAVRPLARALGHVGGGAVKHGDAAAMEARLRMELLEPEALVNSQRAEAEKKKREKAAADEARKAHDAAEAQMAEVEARTIRSDEERKRQRADRAAAVRALLDAEARYHAIGWPTPALLAARLHALKNNSTVAAGLDAWARGELDAANQRSSDDAAE